MAETVKAPQSEYVSFQSSIFAGGEDFRSSSYCTASRERFFRRQGESILADVQEPRPWVAVEEGLRENTIAWALNALSAETQVTAFTHSGNARVRLPNGWEVSLNFGPGGYNAVNRRQWFTAFDLYDRDRFQPEEWANQAPDAEVALFAPDGHWFTPHTFASSQVFGYVSAKDVLRVVDAVARQPGTARPFDGTSDACPCPDCVLERVVDQVVG